MIGRTSGASRFNIIVLGLLGMERIVSKGDDFVVDTLFYFKILTLVILTLLCCFVVFLLYLIL